MEVLDLLFNYEFYRVLHVSFGLLKTQTPNYYRYAIQLFIYDFNQILRGPCGSELKEIAELNEDPKNWNHQASCFSRPYRDQIPLACDYPRYVCVNKCSLTLKLRLGRCIASNLQSSIVIWEFLC